MSRQIRGLQVVVPDHLGPTTFITTISRYLFKYEFKKLTIKELVVSIAIACYTVANYQGFSLEDEIRLKLKEQ